MCGIAGLVDIDGAPLGPGVQPERMRDTMRHRGPDDCGLWRSPDGSVILSHRRLSIVDLSVLGRNPMIWDGGRLTITFNGEIYNFRALRAELEREGVRFRSQTDTEVILAAYDRWGMASVDRFAGMFAFALWDESRRRLWIVRDRFGKKPLYYATRGGVLQFASELKGLIADPDAPREVDPEALRMYLRYGYVPAPLSILKGIRKLPPAHMLVVEGGRLSVQRYWTPLDHVGRHASMGDEEAEATLEERLGTAVRERQLADVPLGAFLSGGIDSSLVVALMREHSSSAVRTFTIRFDDPAFNEADHAAAVARHLGTDHTEQRCSEEELLATVDRLPGMFDEPFGDSSAIPTFLVSAAARRHVTVALSGDGGDELFFGYPRYGHALDSAWMLGLPRPIRLLGAAVARGFPHRRMGRVADVLTTDDQDGYARFITWTRQPEIHRLTGAVSPDAPAYAEMRARAAGVDEASRPPLLDLVSYLPDDILAKVDRTSMAVSLEVRSPLLDHRVAEFALGLPQRLKRRNGRSKWLLRRLLAKRVPPSLTERPKMGFGVPLAAWLRGPLRAQMEDYCKGHLFEEVGVNGQAVRGLWQEFASGVPHRPDIVWQLFVLAAWTKSVGPGASQVVR